MDISVIIVSYTNAEAVLLTLAALRRAMSDGGISAEVIVVDNKSGDGTPEKVRNLAPWARVIEMGQNAGFAKANNVGLHEATGDVLLLLNPDTVVCRDTLSKLVRHFREKPESGAVGVRMVNGQGRYLGESKRGYTTILTSIFKLTGLWRLAPKSRIFNAYYLGHEPETGVCHAPILSGACVAFSRQLYERVGGLDESYFMYGEDIDLSWRMENGAKIGNVYRGDIPIIHFKGQSTPRQRKYIDSFYRSMHIFAQKYEFPRHTRFVNWLTAIGIRVGYYVAMTRCVVMRAVERNRGFTYPRSVTIVSDENCAGIAEEIQRQGAKVRTMRYEELCDAALDETMVFGIDGDVGKAIEFMRRHERAALFGFANEDTGDALVYFNNRLHNLT